MRAIERVGSDAIRAETRQSPGVSCTLRSIHCATTGCCPFRFWLLLDYDVVLNVELSVHVDNIDFNSRLLRASSARRPTPLRGTLAAASRWLLRIRRDYTLHMEELLVVLISCHSVVVPNSCWVVLATSVRNLRLVLSVTLNDA